MVNNLADLAISGLLLAAVLWFIKRYISNTDTKICALTDSIDTLLHKLQTQYIAQKTSNLEHQKEVNTELGKFHSLIAMIKSDLADITIDSESVREKLSKALKELDAQQVRINNLTRIGFLSKKFQESLKTEVVELGNELRLVRDSLQRAKFNKE